MIFDWCDVKSRNKNETNKARPDQNKRIALVHFKVTNTTKILHLETKHFLASVKTNKELFAHKLASDLEKDFDIVLESTCLTNLSDLDDNLKIYVQEEADTGMFLHAMDVCRKNPFSELTISCSDADVLLILLNYFEQLPSIAVFKTTDHR